MSLESATAALKAKAVGASPLGHTVKIDLGADGIIFWDGTGATPTITNQSAEAETTLGISLENLDKLIAGDLDPTMAYMTGKLKISGSMGVALKMSQILQE
jgi:putative sterol carrier protein